MTELLDRLEQRVTYAEYMINEIGDGSSSSLLRIRVETSGPSLTLSRLLIVEAVQGVL